MADTSTAFTGEQYAEPYPAGIERHYWHQARHRIIERKLLSKLEPGAKVLDIGCGPGIAVNFLRSRGVDCRGVDIGTPTPSSAAVAPYLALGVSALAMDDGERQAMTALLFLDVLEHLPRPREFLEECLSSFPRARTIFVTLPARMEIWSNYDEFYGHFRRYDLESLADVAPSGLRVVESGYFFHTLYFMARLLTRTKRNTQVTAPTNALLHAGLGWIFDKEELLLPTRTPGSSLYAVFERRT